jgi:hypothetical protein
MIEYDASNPYAARLRDQHYQMQDLLISVDELKAQVTFLTLERDVLQERLHIAHDILKRAVTTS